MLDIIIDVMIEMLNEDYEFWQGFTVSELYDIILFSMTGGCC